MAASTNRMLDALSSEHSRLVTGVDQLRARVSEIAASVEADAVTLARLARGGDAAAIDTKAITQRICELDTARGDLESKIAQLADLTHGIDAAQRSIADATDA